MARYTGPVCKICRRHGQQLFLKGEKCLTDKCPVKKRPYPPGLHGQRRARKVSDFGQQLREKQRTRRIYGVLEKQFRKEFALADKQQGPTGENMLRVLEQRLDNVVFRLGFAESRPQARQIVTHGHFEVNGRKLDIPSALVRAGDVISVRSHSRESEYFKVVADTLARKKQPGWLSLDAANMSGKIMRMPRRDEVDMEINEPLIVEFYSR